MSILQMATVISSLLESKDDDNDDDKRGSNVLSPHRRFVPGIGVQQARGRGARLRRHGRRRRRWRESSQSIMWVGTMQTSTCRGDGVLAGRQQVDDGGDVRGILRVQAQVHAGDGSGMEEGVRTAVA